MIASPCKNCRNLNVPKEFCLDNCRKIQEMQEMQLKMPLQVYSAVDSSDSSRYRVSVAISMPFFD